MNECSHDFDSGAEGNFSYFLTEITGMNAVLIAILAYHHRSSLYADSIVVNVWMSLRAITDLFIYFFRMYL